jgi:hypothetical protein
MQPLTPKGEKGKDSCIRINCFKKKKRIFNNYTPVPL